MLLMQYSKHKAILSAILGLLLVVGAVFWYVKTHTDQAPVGRMVTVTVPDGLRKEQTADIFAQTLGWTKEQKRKFIVEDTARDFNHVDGVFPGGLYTISTASSTYEVASMLLDVGNARYQELGSDLTPDEWYEVLKVAAIVEKEAVSPDMNEMERIAGTIWEKRRSGTLIKSDATVAYARDSSLNYYDNPCQQDAVPEKKPFGDGPPCAAWRLNYHGTYAEEHGWWNPVTEDDRKLDLGYNTYVYPGLPQHPIDTPSREAILATLATR